MRIDQTDAPLRPRLLEEQLGRVARSDEILRLAGLHWIEARAGGARAKANA